MSLLSPGGISTSPGSTRPLFDIAIRPSPSYLLISDRVKSNPFGCSCASMSKKFSMSGGDLPISERISAELKTDPKCFPPSEPQLAAPTSSWNAKHKTTGCPAYPRLRLARPDDIVEPYSQSLAIKWLSIFRSLVRSLAEWRS
jgi:hypothetical protein